MQFNDISQADGQQLNVTHLTAQFDLSTCVPLCELDTAHQLEVTVASCAGTRRPARLFAQVAQLVSQISASDKSCKEQFEKWWLKNG